MNPFDKLGLAQLRASELKTCIYCSNALPSRSKEHLFSACCGGTYKSSRFVCDSCNQAFSALDPALTPYATLIMNAWGFKSDRHTGTPVVPLDGDCELGPMATPRLKAPSISATALPDGTHAVKVTVRSKSEARRLLLDGGAIERAVGHKLTEAQKDEIRRTISTAKTTETEIGPSPHEANLCFSDEFRLAAHTVLKSVALYDPDLVRDDITKPVRQFARHDIGKVEDFAVVTVENLSPFPEIQRVHGVLQNTALIYWSKVERKIIGVFHLLGRITRSVILAEDYPGPDAFLCLYETVHGAPQPKAMFAQLRTEVVPVPLMEIVARPPTTTSLLEDFNRLAHGCMVDAIQARMVDRLQGCTSTDPLTLDHVAAIEEVLASSLIECSRALGQQLSKEGARKLVRAAVARTRLTVCLGQPSNSIAVQEAAAALFLEAGRNVLCPRSGTTARST